MKFYIFGQTVPVYLSHLANLEQFLIF